MKRRNQIEKKDDGSVVSQVFDESGLLGLEDVAVDGSVTFHPNPNIPDAEARYKANDAPATEEAAGEGGEEGSGDRFPDDDE